MLLPLAAGAAGLLGIPGMLGIAGAGASGDGNFFQNLGQSFNDWWTGASAATPVGGPEDISNVNPYTDPFYQQMMGTGQNTQNLLMQSLGGDNPFYASTQGFLNNMDPNAAFEYFQNNMAGSLRGMAEDNFAAYNTANQAVADRMSNQAVQNIASQFGNRGPGALRSGGAMQAIGEGAINPLLQSNAQIANMIGGQAGQLQGMGMGQAYGAQNLANQLGLQGRLGMMGSADQRAMADQSLLGNMWGTAVGQQGAMADPWLYQQQWMNNPNYLGLGNILNMAGQIGGMAAGGV